MFISYPKIDSLAKTMENNYFKEGEFSKEINSRNYALYYKILKENKKILPTDILLEDGYKKYLDEAEIEEFNNSINMAFNRIKKPISNLKYYAANIEDKKYETNIKTNINILENGNIDLSSINLEDYEYYIIINYDKDGNVNIDKIKGIDKDVFKSNLYEAKNFNYPDNMKLLPIKNMVYFYGVPNYVEADDYYKYNIEGTAYNEYERLAMVFVAIAVAFIILSALIMPYKRQKDILGFKIVSKIPLEILIIIIFLMSVFILEVYGITGELISFKGTLVDRIKLDKNTINNMNIIIWFIYFYCIFFGVIAIKYMLSLNVKEYVKKHTLVGKIFLLIVKIYRKLIKVSEKLANLINNIDFSERDNKMILKVVTVNAIILSLFTLFWFFGVIGVVIYSVLLFVFIKKYFDEIRNKYKILKEATNMIAKGDLDIRIQEDIGMFEPLKEDLEKIQLGFKCAIEEEVKSQKMKTDLISNVSHDLKTPLTSIITYVDLLKSENLSEEKRKQYLDTLDRKSQRLQMLIEDLFEMSKVSSGNIKLNIESIDIVSLVKQTLLELEDKVEEAGLKVRRNFPDNKITLQLDGQRTFRIFENLVLNITKYAMKNTRVYIDIVELEEDVEIVLKNITEDELNFNADEITERFVRGDVSRNTEGSGLGLAIAKSFVELQGGQFKISVDGDLFKACIRFNK